MLSGHSPRLRDHYGDALMEGRLSTWVAGGVSAAGAGDGWSRPRGGDADGMLFMPDGLEGQRGWADLDFATGGLARRLTDVDPLARYDPEFAAAQKTSWDIRVPGQTAAEYRKKGMLTDQEYMALLDARMYGQLTGEWGDFTLVGSHAATPEELYMRELLTQMPQSRMKDLPFNWRVNADIDKPRGPTYEDLEFWVPEGKPLPQEFFDFVYERAPSLKNKKVDWAYTTKHGDQIAPGIYFGEGGAERVPAPWAHKLGDVPGTILARPEDILYSQSSIGSHYKDGQRVSDTISELVSGEASPSDIPPIEVFVKLPFMNDWGPLTSGRYTGDPANLRDHGLYTLDNRRLYAYKQAGIEEIPIRWVTDIDYLLEQRWKFSTETYGETIEVR